MTGLVRVVKTNEKGEVISDELISVPKYTPSDKPIITPRTNTRRRKNLEKVDDQSKAD